MSGLTSWVEKRWYGEPGVLKAFLPISALFSFIAERRRKKATAQAQAFSVPVIVVGNISVGGTGKTPTIIALVECLQAQGLKVGVVSRGYGRKTVDPKAVVIADDCSTPQSIGDEPFLIYRATSCALAVSAQRVEAVKALINQQHCNVILSDDGLQHYSMHRDKEIAVVDAQREFGNGHLLPVGPLREPPSRLRTVDWVLYNCADETCRVPDTAHAIHVKPQYFVNVISGETVALDQFPSKPCVAMAGLGNPQKFFTTLEGLGINFEARPFPDHHAFCEEDFRQLKDRVIVMTEKDAVKCQHLVGPETYYLKISMALPQSFLNELITSVNACLDTLQK